MESQFTKIRFLFSGGKAGQAVCLLCGDRPHVATTSTGLCARDLSVSRAGGTPGDGPANLRATAGAKQHSN